MLKIIKSNNKIFKSSEFQKDKYKFNLMIQNLFNLKVELYSDEESYIICKSLDEAPIWIWTKDNLKIDKIDEIEKFLINNKKYKFICKKELYDILIKRNIIKNNNYYEMGFLICYKTNW